MGPLLVKLITNRMRHSPVPFFIRPLVRTIASKLDTAFTDPELAAHFGWIEQTLAAQAYFAGERFSAADIQMSYPIQASFLRGNVLPSRPHTRAWLDRMESYRIIEECMKRYDEVKK